MNGVLLLALNARYTHSNLALMYIEKYIEGACGDVLILERGVNEKSESIIAAIAAQAPPVIAISVYIWNTARVKELIPQLRKSLPGTVIVLGGPDAGYNAAEWMDSPCAPDYIVAGPGEAGMLKLAESGFTLEEKVIREKNPPFAEIPFPYNRRHMERLAGKFIYYESSRGCPFRCSYCLSSREDQKLEFRPVEMVCDELDLIVSFNPHLVKFVDRTFNSRKDHYRPIWEHIAGNYSQAGTTFHFEIYPGLLDDDDMKFLASVPGGLFQFEIGIQSVHDATLESVHRAMDSRSYDVIEQLISRDNIHVHLDLIAGLPFEDYAGFGNSFNRVLGLRPHHFQPGILKVLPGTEMMERAGDYALHYSPDPPYAVKSTRWLRAEEMERITLIADLVERIYNSGRFIETGWWFSAQCGSAFAFYEKLALFCYGKEIGRHWEDTAEILIAFAQHAVPGSAALLMDHLRWDWCVTGTVHHYPVVLKSDFTTEAKRAGYAWLMKHSKHNVITIEGQSITKEELRHAIFFMPETESFRERMMKAPAALFLRDKGVVWFKIPE